MAIKTKIQWCDSTVNPTMGCDGCELWNPKADVKRCYAGVLHERHGATNRGYAPEFNQVTRFPGRMAEAAKMKDLRGVKRPEDPWLDGCRRLIFVSDMSDSLSDAVSFEYLESEIVRHADSPLGRRHVWLWLTKRAGRMGEFAAWMKARDIGWPSNLWPGTSVTSKGTINRIGELSALGDEQTVRFLSVEPQWEDFSLAPHLGQIHWVIQGGESGAAAKPFDLAWARRLRDESRTGGVAYFLKQVGEKPLDGKCAFKLGDRHGGNWAEWPEDLRVREIPTAASG